jgi:DNA-binding PadR family transcriptional regulator
MGHDLLESYRHELRRGTGAIACLALLAREPDYGYSLIARLSALGFELEANTLYPLLRRLDTQGLLTSEWNTEESRPRKFYRTSSLGLELLSALRKDWAQITQTLDDIKEG